MKEVSPKMHTAEHIINQAMNREFACGRCFSAHIEKKKSKLDYHFNGPITEEAIKAIEVKINEIVERNLAVIEEMMDVVVAKQTFDLTRIPDHKLTQLIRVIKIGDYDACPCAGEHVARTKEIGKIKITTFDLIDKVLRLRYKLEDR